MKTAYELKDGEVIYTPSGDKVATYDGETLRMARGQAEEHKESVEAWLASHVPTPADPIPEGLPEVILEKPKRGEIPPKPIGTTYLGEKDPEVIAWNLQYGTDEEKERAARWKEMYRL